MLPRVHGHDLARVVALVLVITALTGGVVIPEATLLPAPASALIAAEPRQAEPARAGQAAGTPTATRRSTGPKSELSPEPPSVPSSPRWSRRNRC